MAHCRLGDRSAKTTSFLQHNGNIIDTSAKLKRLWSQILFSMVDDADLRSYREVSVSNSWVSDGTNFLSDRDYISYSHVKYDC